MCVICMLKWQKLQKLTKEHPSLISKSLLDNITSETRAEAQALYNKEAKEHPEIALAMTVAALNTIDAQIMWTPSKDKYDEEVKTKASNMSPEDLASACTDGRIH